MAIRSANSATAVTDERRAGPPPVSSWQSAKVVTVVSRTARVKSVFLEPRERFSFRAGQHVDVRLTADDGYRAQRSYSIASEPESPGPLELAIERLDDGEVSPFLHDELAPGDELELRGPIGGHFVWSVSDGGPLLFVAGGSGIVPLRSMIRHHAAQRAREPLLLLFSAPTWDEVIFRDELLAYEAKERGLAVVLTLTREPARRAGDFSRRVDDAMLVELLARFAREPKLSFVCGSNPFVAAAAGALVRAGVDPATIRTERYGG
jgi:ferredoxin-NADP reductase